MQSQLENYIDYCLIQRDTSFKAMFGGTGLFYHGAMYVLIDDQRVYLRGGGRLNTALEDHGCVRFEQVKKTVSVVVNYYDVTDCFYADRHKYCQLENLAKVQSRADKVIAKRRIKRIRDLPNMRLTLERMVKKVGVHNVEQLIELGALQTYQRVQSVYGQQVDETLLLKFAGAIEGVHWQLVSDETKLQLGLINLVNSSEESKRPCQ